MIISLFRDGLSGTRYVIYVIICSTLLFSIIGYLFKQKYGKVEFKVASSGATTKISKPEKVKKGKSKKEKKSKGTKTSNPVTPAAPLPSVQPQPVQKTPVQATQVVQTPKPVQQVSTPVQVQLAPTAPIPDATKVASIPEPTLVAKSGTQQQPQVAPATLSQPTSLPDLGASKTGNPVIDDDITTII